MNLFNLEHIEISLDIKSKEDLYDYISNKLFELSRITSAEDFKKNLWLKEKEGTTGIGDGIAIPHTKDISVLFPTMLYLRLINPIDYASVDNKPINHVFVIAMPSSYYKEHLEVLSNIAQTLMDDESKEVLETSNNVKDIYKLLEKNICRKS